MRAITRVPNCLTGFDDAFADQVEKYVMERYVNAFPNVFLEIAVDKLSDYYQVTVFLTDGAVMEKATELATELSDELADQGHYVFVYAKSWDRAA